MKLAQVEIETIIEALRTAASRHESQAHRTKGYSRYQHDWRARQMHELRIKLQKSLIAEPASAA